MFKVEFLSGLATVALDATDPEQAVAPVFDGDESTIDMIKRSLDRSYGVFGHGVSSGQVNINDLHATLFKELKKFLPKVVEGESLVKYPVMSDGETS